jgi:hypothetical protein
MKYFAEKFGCSAEHPYPAVAPSMRGDVFFYVLFFTFAEITLFSVRKNRLPKSYPKYFSFFKYFLMG